MTDDKISREELDQFSANILINLALINAAALAATISVSGSEMIKWPYAVGLISAIISQVLWFGDSAFDHVFGNAEDRVNQKIEVCTSFGILIFGAVAASSIIYGCLSLVGLSGFSSIILALVTCFIPLILLIYKARREFKSRQITTSK